MTDEAIAEFRRDQRLNIVLVVAVVIGIIAGAGLGLAYTLGAFGSVGAGYRNPGALIFFIGPPAVCIGIGYAIRAILRRRKVA